MKKVGFLFLLLAIVPCSWSVKSAYASVGGDGVDLSDDTCDSGTCYNGTVWVHYTYKRKATTIVGKDWGPFYYNITSSLSPSEDSINGTNGTSVRSDCYDYGGFWHLEHVMSSIGNEIYNERVAWAFGNSGVGYAYNVAGVRTDVTGPYIHSVAADMRNDTHPGSVYGQYDSNVVTPHYYSWATMKNIKAIYRDYYDKNRAAVDNVKPGVFFNKNSSYTYFCGGPEIPPPPPPPDIPDDDPDDPDIIPEDDFDTAEVKPGASISLKNPGASGYVNDGDSKYTAVETGSKTFSTKHFITRVNAQDKKEPKFKTRQSYYGNGAWGSWSTTSLREISGLNVNSKTSWDGSDQSASVSYNDNYKVLCGRTQSWSSYYKVGEESSVLEYTGKKSAKDCVSVRGPRTGRVNSVGKVTITISDSDGNNSQSCSASNCKYYANQNTLTFKVSGTYQLERDFDSGPAVPIRFGTSYSSSGAVSEPGYSSYFTLSSGGSNSVSSSDYFINLGYNGKQKVCFSMGYQGSIMYNLTKYSKGSSFSSSTIDSDYDSSNACVTIYAPRYTTPTFLMSGLNSTFDSSIVSEGSETYWLDSQSYSIGMGTGLQSVYGIGQGAFNIKRTDTEKNPAVASSQYKTQFLSGPYTSTPAFSTGKLSTGNLTISGTSNDTFGPAMVTGGASKTITVPIGTERASRYSYAYCNYGQYDTRVSYITYWTKTNGKANASGVKKVYVEVSGTRDFAGKVHECYALYNPAQRFEASFEAESDGIILDNYLKNPGITKTYDEKEAIINNSHRLSGDDAGRYDYIYKELRDSGVSQVDYSLRFWHKIKLSDTSVIPNWVKKAGASSTYQSVTTSYKVQESNLGGADGTWTTVKDSLGREIKGSTSSFSTAGESKAVATMDPILSIKSPDWGIGKYWTYCQRVEFNKKVVLKTNSSGSGVHVVDDVVVGGVTQHRDYWISEGEESDVSYSAKACVVLKNPEWVEEDKDDWYHEINVRGYATGIGANDPGNAEYATGMEGVKKCTDDYEGISGDDCGVAGEASEQYNMLEKSASVYFSQDVRRYDNGQFNSYVDISLGGSAFDELDTGRVKTSGANQNFWPEACLKVRTASGGLSGCKTLGGEKQRNSMYYLLDGAGYLANNDPFAVSSIYSGNIKISSYLDTTNMGSGSWVDGDRSGVPVGGIASPDGGLKVGAFSPLVPANSGSAEFFSETSLGASGDNAETTLRGETWSKFGMEGSDADKIVRAGETKVVCHATRTNDSGWRVKYAGVYRNARYTKDGMGNYLASVRSEAAYFDRYELRSEKAEPRNVSFDSENWWLHDGDGNLRKGQDCLSLKRDWNYNITAATLSDSDLSGVPTINSGESVDGTFTLTVERDNEPEDEGVLDTKGWIAVDGEARNYITDVSGDRTKASLVLYSLKPYEELPDMMRAAMDVDEYHGIISTAVNSATVRSESDGAAAGELVIDDENYCRRFQRILGDGMGECVDVSNVEGSGKWERGGMLTGDDWGYSAGVGVIGGEIGLTLDPTTIKHTGDGGFGSEGLPSDGEFGKVKTSDSYTLSMPLPSGGVRSFKMTSGAKFCVAVAIQAKSSTSTHIFISESNCKNIVKNPQFSVWGGDVGVKGGISTTFTKGDGKLMGSWGDFGLIVNGKINAMASGRGFGNPYEGSWSSGGELENVSEMTLANRGATYGYANVEGLEVNKQLVEGNGLVDRFVNGGSRGKVCLNESAGEEEFDSDKVAMIMSGCGMLDRVVIKREMIKINGNIKLSDLGLGESLGSIGEVPQVIFVGEKISVKENVEQVDAWLVASGEINTCGYKDGGAGTIRLSVGLADDSPEVSAGSARNISKNDCYKKLQVNGPVVGGKIYLRRTQGGDGLDNLDYSLEGAPGVITDWEDLRATVNEISENVDYNPGALLFSISESSDLSPRVVYHRELAPRY